MLNNELIETVEFIKSLYPTDKPVPLHAPRFLGNEKKYLCECIDSTFVSYVGKFVTDFEQQIKNLTNTKNAIAFVNGTAALHITLIAGGVNSGDAVITQALTFAATAAAIKHANAEPIFVDVDLDTMGMSPKSLREFLSDKCEKRGNAVFSKQTGKRIAAVLPMHTFGHMARITEIKEICEEFGITLFEDAAESLGSKLNNKPAETFGRAAILSFNGNKTITTGGGGMVITNDDILADKIRHLSTTAKSKHPWEFFHDAVGYNLRMPNVNAAIGCAQMEYLDKILTNKRQTAELYSKFFKNISSFEFFHEPYFCTSNYWLNCIVLKNREERESFLKFTNEAGVQTRPIWTLMHKLPPYSNCERDALINSLYLEDRIVNIPSSLRT